MNETEEVVGEAAELWQQGPTVPSGRPGPATHAVHRPAAAPGTLDTQSPAPPRPTGSHSAAWLNPQDIRQHIKIDKCSPSQAQYKELRGKGC